MTPPPRRCSVFGGTPPRKRPAPHPCPSGRTKTAPLPSGRRFPFASMPDAPHPPQHGTLRAWTAPLGLRNIYGKTKGHGKKWKPRRFYAADYTRPAHVPALLSVRFVLAAVTGRPKHPARLVLSGRAQGDGAGKPRTSNRRIFCASNWAQITENLRKAGPPDRPIFAF